MKKIKHLMIAGLTAMLALLQGCALESEQFSEISPDLYPRTQRDAEDLLTGNVYAPFRMNGYDGIFNRANGMQILSDVGSDYGMCAWGFPGLSWGPLGFGQVTPSIQYGATMNYDKGYPGYFSKMIMTIERIKAMDLAEEVKNRYIAEAQCGLAFLGYMLYDYHGPLIVPDVETLLKAQEAIILPRMSEAAMIAFIEDNLKAAVTVLPDTYAYKSENYGRFTAGLCHTLLL
ncbi:MAG: RagB/SusD family nutrient uptake outer membrane protein, partial [Mediterranea sp.]|nr:RagB/SusD family nutrient uptake outer membrane protein [Mediterranea sp.]